MTSSPSIEPWLLVAGSASGAASLLHLAVIAGGPRWYRFFGAGEGMARAAEKGLWRPALVTVAIALVLAAWAAYAFAGGGLVDAAWLPWRRPALCAITAVYLLRGLAILPALIRPATAATPFLIWSSAICLAIGLAHLAGLLRAWPRL